MARLDDRRTFVAAAEPKGTLDTPVHGPDFQESTSAIASCIVLAPTSGCAMTSLPNVEQERVATAETTYNEDSPGPWRRFFARCIDEWAVGIFLSVLIPSSLTVRYMRVDGAFGGWLFGYFCFWLIYIVIEALLISSFGTTLGKRLLAADVSERRATTPFVPSAYARLDLPGIVRVGDIAVPRRQAPASAPAALPPARAPPALA